MGQQSYFDFKPSRTRVTGIIAFAFCWLCVCSPVCGQDKQKPGTISFTTKEGVEYKDVRVSRVLETGITIFTESGVATLPNWSLPDELLQTLSIEKNAPEEPVQSTPEWTIEETKNEVSKTIQWKFQYNISVDLQCDVNLIFTFKNGIFQNPETWIYFLEKEKSYGEDVLTSTATFMVDGRKFELHGDLEKYEVEGRPTYLHSIEIPVETLKQIAVGSEVSVNLCGKQRLLTASVRDAFRASLNRWLHRIGSSELPPPETFEIEERDHGFHKGNKLGRVNAIAALRRPRRNG